MRAALVVAITLVGCGQPPKAPPPTAALVPDAVAVIVAWDFLDCSPGRYVLDNGETIDIAARDGCASAPRSPTPVLEGGIYQSGGRGPVKDGGLILYARDGRSIAWYAAARPGSDQDGAACPYEMRAAAYSKGDHIHFASGLLLPKGPRYRVEPAWIEQPEDILPRGALFCLDRMGRVVGARLDLTY